MSPQELIATEIKWELTRGEMDKVSARLTDQGFTPAREEWIEDFYIQWTESPQGGKDFVRLRKIDETRHILSRKYWIQNTKGQWVRAEDESPLTLEEFELKFQESSNYLSTIKKRQNYSGVYHNRNYSVALDTMEIPDGYLYFIEAETLSHPDEYETIRQGIVDWYIQCLKLSSRQDTRCMLELMERMAWPAF